MTHFIFKGHVSSGCRVFMALHGFLVFIIYKMPWFPIAFFLTLNSGLSFSYTECHPNLPPLLGINPITMFIMTAFFSWLARLWSLCVENHTLMTVSSLQERGCVIFSAKENGACKSKKGICIFEFLLGFFFTEVWLFTFKGSYPKWLDVFRRKKSSWIFLKRKERNMGKKKKPSKKTQRDCCQQILPSVAPIFES